MIKVAVILGSTRPGRNGEAVAQWVYDIASKRDDAEYDLVDLKDFPLPHLEALPPSLGQYANQHTKDWSEKTSTPRGTTKAAGFVSYGAVGGTRAVEHL